LALDSHKQRLLAIEKALQDSPAVRAAAARVSDVNARLQAAQIAVKHLEMDVQNVDEKLSATENRMYSGKVVSPKELQDLQKEQASLKKRRATLEEENLEALIKVESIETERTQAQTMLQQAESDSAHLHEALYSERETLRQQVAKRDDERSALVSGVTADDLQLYQRLRASKSGRPVARLEDGSCTACGVEATSSRTQEARRGNDLVRCTNCDRIFFAE
jgi:predicted  nucleic acid-binding Zn-ribbon protein